MGENECKGCIYDIYDMEVTETTFIVAIETCQSCKRAMKKEYQNEFPDLYKPSGK